MSRFGITYNWPKHTGQLKEADDFGTLDSLRASSIQCTLRIGHVFQWDS